MVQQVQQNVGVSGYGQTLAGARIAIIEARFYHEIADALAKGAIEEIEAAGASYERFSVPGALEIPQVLSLLTEANMIQRADYGIPRGSAGFIAGAAGSASALADATPPSAFDGAIALGCVIRGETSHYETVCDNTNHFWMQLAIARNIPVGNGILTVESAGQAWARADGGRKGKGGDAARACLGLIALRRGLNSRAMAERERR